MRDRASDVTSVGLLLPEPSNRRNDRTTSHTTSLDLDLVEQPHRSDSTKACV